jgi:hypothetical protein
MSSCADAPKQILLEINRLPVWRRLLFAAKEGDPAIFPLLLSSPKFARPAATSGRQFPFDAAEYRPTLIPQ